MGYGTKRVLDRMLAACGLFEGAALEFTADDDVPQAGVLCALPSCSTRGSCATRAFFTPCRRAIIRRKRSSSTSPLLALVRCRSLEELHRLGSSLEDAAVVQLCETLTATETCFPTTDLRLAYRRVGSD